MVSQPVVNEKSKKLLEKKKRQEEEQKQSSLTRDETKDAANGKRQANKVVSQAEIKKRMASPQSNETFKPNISKKSAQIAESKRAGQKIEDHLLLEGKKT